MPKEPETVDIEDPLKESGLLGKNPNSKVFIRSFTPPLQAPAQIQDSPKILRPKTRQKPAHKQPQLTQQQLQMLKEYMKTPRRPQTSLTRNLDRKNLSTGDPALSFNLPTTEEHDEQDDSHVPDSDTTDDSKNVSANDSKNASTNASANASTSLSPLRKLNGSFRLSQRAPSKDEITLSTFADSKTIDAPNVFYAKYLNPNEPPSDTNFAQLSEMLDRLISSEAIEAPGVYNKIFGDIVRQYYIECTLQGDLLNQCRNFFFDAQGKIPGIRYQYEKRIKEIEDQISALQKLCEQYGPEVIENGEHSKHLTVVISDMRNDLQILINHYDQIVKQVAAASKEAASMKEEMMQLDNRIAEKNKMLMDLNNDLRTLDTLSSDYTADTLRFAENLKQIRQQEAETRDAIKKANEDMESYKQQIYALDREITDATVSIEKSRIRPAISEVEVQCDLISRRLFNEKKTEEEAVKDSVPKNVEMAGDLFNRIKNEFHRAVLQTDKDKDISVGTYDDFAKLKNIILEHEKEFRMDDEEIMLGQSGNYVITKDSLDFLRLFSSKIVSNAISNACKKFPRTAIWTQTLLPQPEVVPDVEKKANVKNETGFLSLLKSDYSNRSPRRLEWILSEIRQIYDEKTVENEKSLSNHEPLNPFCNFVYEFGKRKMKLDFLTDQYGWDIYITAHEHADRALEVELFTAFLDEQFNDEQLAFFLRARTDCIKVGCSVAMRTTDQLETLTEYYLSQDQIEKALKRWWAKRYQRKFYMNILELSIARPAIHLEATKRYVAMHDILQYCVFEYQNDVIARLKEQLTEYRIVPRLVESDFDNLVYSLIPALTPEQAQDFYRATVTKAKTREEIDVDDFIQKFHEGCLLYHQDLKDPGYGISAVSSRMHGAVEQLWFRNKQNIIKIIEFFQNQLALQPDNISLKMYLDDATRFQSMLSHSLTTGDGDASSQHYFMLLLTLDVMYSTLGYINADLLKPSLLSIECAIRESWLDNVFSE